MCRVWMDRANFRYSERKSVCSNQTVRVSQYRRSLKVDVIHHGPLFLAYRCLFFLCHYVLLAHVPPLDGQ